MQRLPQFFPFITGKVAYNKFRVSDALLFPLPPNIRRSYNDYLAFFALNWELDFWGRISGASEEAYAELLSQVEARRAVVLTLVSSIANAYITLRKLDSLLEISKKTLDSRIESLKLAINRFELGETSELEVKQAEAEVEIAAISALEFERAIPQQENLLSVLIGENPSSIERGRSIETFEYPQSIPAGLPSDLLVRRPDIVEAEDLLIAKNAEVTHARALFFPQIILTGKYGSESILLKNFLSSPAEFWQYGISALQILFDAGKTRYQVEAAKAEREEALAAYRQTILIAFKEVNDGLVACKMNQELVIERQKQVKVLSDYLKLATLRYQEGEVDYLNVLDAERSLFDAQLSQTEAYANNFTAVVQLYSALGGGWVDDADAFAISE